VYRRVKNAITIANFLKRESNRKAILRASRAGPLVSPRFNINAVNRLPLPNLKRKPSVLIVYNPYLRQCIRYRVQQKIEALRRQDIQYEVIPENELKDRSALRGFTHYLFQRPEPTEAALQAMLDSAAQGKVILDIDDAIFSKEALDSNPGLKGLSSHLVASFYKAVPYYQEMLRVAHNYCASTKPLAELATKHRSGQVTLWRNSIDEQHLAVARYYSEQEWPVKLPFNILMTSLSSGVEHDLDQAKDIIREVMARESTCVLSLAGPAPKTDWLASLEGRVRSLPALNYLPHLFRVARFPVTFVPLADNIFNQCKSAIRVQESFLLATDILCSGTHEFAHVRKELEAGDTIYILDSLDSAIEHCIRALSRRQERKDIRTAIGSRLERICKSTIYLPNVSGVYVREILQ